MLAICFRYPLSFAMMGLGVAAGASTPYQTITSKPGRPDSATVGRSGISEERLKLVTASGLNRPALIMGSTAGMFAIIMVAWPLTRSVTAGAVPLYGTCTILMPAVSL